MKNNKKELLEDWIRAYPEANATGTYANASFEQYVQEAKRANQRAATGGCFTRRDIKLALKNYTEADQVLDLLNSLEYKGTR